jgi:hypothetical protein
VSALGLGSPPQYQERVQSDTGQKGLEAPVPNRQPQVLGQLSFHPKIPGASVAGRALLAVKSQTAQHYDLCISHGQG